MNTLKFIELVDVKAKMALKSDASRLYLSYLWWVLEPVLWVLMFYLVFTVLLGFGRDLLFLMCGKIPFLWFSKSVQSSAKSIISGQGLIQQTNVPKQFFPYEQVHIVLYRQWLVFLVLAGMAVVYGHVPTVHWLWVVPLMIVQYLLILTASLIAALLVSFVRDLRVIISMGIMGLMFSSGVFWDINRIADPVKRDLLITWNPLAFLIDAYRDVFIHGTMFDVVHLIGLAGVLLALLALVHVFYRYMDQLIAFKVINS